MKNFKRRMHQKALGVLCAAGVVCQLGGCEFGEVSTEVTLSSRELVISLIRGAILAPIDRFITDAVNEAFEEDD